MRADYHINHQYDESALAVQNILDVTRHTLDTISEVGAEAEPSSVV